MLVLGGAPAALAAGTLADYRLLVLDGGMVKWGVPALGEGAVVTYAVTTRPRNYAGARNCASLVPLTGLLAKSRIGRSLFEAELRRAFDAWSDVADIAFRPADEESADILIGGQGIPTGRAFTNVVREAPLADDAVGSIAASLICLNPAQGWKIGFDGNLDVYDIRYTLMHEIGHAIGLDHPGTRDALMDFRYVEAFSTLQAGDRAGAANLYGAPLAGSVGTAARQNPVPFPAEGRSGGEERAFGATPRRF